MFDAHSLQAPSHNSEILVAPDAQASINAALKYHKELDRSELVFAGRRLGQWRREIRKGLGIPLDTLLMVTGHQPDFLHSGVWAKYVFAYRMANACDGHAINIAVDSDAPKNLTLTIPQVVGESIAQRKIPLAKGNATDAFESLPPINSEVLTALRNEIQAACGARYALTQMPRFLDAFSAAPRDRLVSQMLAGRQAIDHAFGVNVRDVCVSQLPWSTLLVDAIARAESFASAYNSALAVYRTRYRVRGVGRPVPDLLIYRARCELPVWANRPQGYRRRLFIARHDDQFELFAGDDQIGAINQDQLVEWAATNNVPEALNGWRFRPRALMLTLWARLFLADLFIHGIGGAKYDRVNDDLIRGFFGIEPPPFACVTATLHLDLPRSDVTDETLRVAKETLRRLHWNPHEHTNGASVDQRQLALAEAQQLATARPKDRTERARFWRQIRECTEEIRRAIAGKIAAQKDVISLLERRRQENRLATNREYFVGLFPDEALQRLCDSLFATRTGRL